MKQSITEIIKGILYDQELRTWVNNFISNDKGTSEDVEGMVQDAAIVLWINLEKGKQIKYPKAFVKEVIRKKWNQQSKRDRNRKEKISHWNFKTSELSSVEEDYIKKEMRDLVLNVIRKMGEPCSKILILTLVERMKPKEIADLFPDDQDADWIKKQSYKCRLKLYKLLLQYPEFKDRFNGDK